FFCANPRVGPRRVDEGDDGTIEFLGQFHQPKRFPVSFGIWHTKVPLHPLLESPSFLMSDDHDRAVVESGKAADDGPVVTEGPIAMEFRKIVRQFGDVIERARALGMASQLRSLPRG